MSGGLDREMWETRIAFYLALAVMMISWLLYLIDPNNRIMLFIFILSTAIYFSAGTKLDILKTIQQHKKEEVSKDD